MDSATARQGATAVSLASINVAVAVAVVGTNHGLRDFGATVTKVSRASSVAHRPHLSQLQSLGWPSTKPRISPTTDRARRAVTNCTAWQGKGLHAIVQIEGLLQLQQGDVQVFVPIVVIWVCDLPTHTPALPIAVR